MSSFIMGEGGQRTGMEREHAALPRPPARAARPAASRLACPGSRLGRLAHRPGF